MPEMTFENRLKGNLTETIVKALLLDEGYRVIDSGIEHLIREISCLSQSEYTALPFANELRKLPDLIVMNRKQTEAYLVEVKYRQSWNNLLIQNLKEQVAFFNKIVLVCVNGNPKIDSNSISGGSHLRAIELKFEQNSYQAKKYISKGPGMKGDFEWVSLDEGISLVWWDLAPMQFVFNEMTSNAHSEGHSKHGTNVNTLLSCRAIFSLMNPDIWKL